MFRIKCKGIFLTVLIYFSSVMLFGRKTEELKIDKYGIYEVSFTASANYDNPYTDLKAFAEFVAPDGSVRKIPLFWDGGKTFKLRFSPDIEGKWSYTVNSIDRSLNGLKGSFICVPSSLKGAIKAMSDFPHHFQYSNGEKMWFMGETAWALFNDNEDEKLDRAAFEHFIRKRVSQGFNAVHAMLLSEAGWGNSGGMPFIDIEKQVLNPGYWQEVDSRVAFANEHGLIVGLVLAWGDKNKKVPFPWRLFPDIEARKNYAQYIAARYSAYNVYFVVSGEWHAEIRTRPGEEDEVRNEFVEIGNILHEADPHGRMIAIHPMNSNGSVREFNQASWMSFGDYQQNYRNLHERALQSMIFNKPVVNSEYGYFLRDQDGNGLPDKDNSTSLESIRHASWDIVMAGSYFITGFGTTYFGGNRDPGPFDVDAEKNHEWENQSGFIKGFFEGIEYWKLKPADSLLSCNTPRGKDDRHLNKITPPAITYWLLSEPGKQYVVYARGISEKITVTIDKASETEFLVRLFNPRTGESTTLKEHTVIKGKYDWTPPDKNDWVLYICGL